MCEWCTVWVKKSPPWCFPTIFLKRLGIFSPNWTHLLNVPINSTLDYKFLSNYLQFWRSYVTLSATTQFTPHFQNVHHRPKRMLAFSDIFPKQLGIFGQNFTYLLHVPIYARLQMFIQLSPTLTKLCHIKYDHVDHPACISTDGGHFEHIMVVALNMA